MYNNLSNWIAYSNFTKLVGLTENNTQLSINVSFKNFISL